MGHAGGDRDRGSRAWPQNGMKGRTFRMDLVEIGRNDAYAHARRDHRDCRGDLWRGLAQSRREPGL